ncbi:hypothetical protein [Streptomyces sp. NPDC050548]|uniref:hypothetical protein n=1 Tax=Streptomyces sp. NPDC050548 TaxID=3365629 RepID=UPI0037BCA17E
MHSLGVLQIEPRGRRGGCPARHRRRFVDTPLTARLLGAELELRHEELRATLPIRRVVGPSDVAAPALRLMTNTALTGATYGIDGGRQLIP